MNNKKNLTIKEFSEIIQQDYLATTALVKLMVTVGAAKKVGNRTVEGKKGKPSAVFEIESSFEVDFWQDENEPEDIDVDSSEKTANVVAETSVEVPA